MIVWIFFDWFSKAILIYVLVGFDLFTRMLSLKDIKFAKDKKERKK